MKLPPIIVPSCRKIGGRRGQRKVELFLNNRPLTQKNKGQKGKKKAETSLINRPRMQKNRGAEGNRGRWNFSH
jgi:hypothetical protein